MRSQHVAEQIYHRPWLITPSGHASVQQLFESHLAKSNSPVTFEADSGDDASKFYVQRQPCSLDENRIGHVYIQGVIGQGLSALEKTCGNTDTRDVQAEIAGLLAQGAKGLLLCIDSPGGTITGTPELAETIFTTAQELPVVVFTDARLCSAAYWLAAGASKIICTESADIGSIGVYFPWIDKSALWEQEGIAADPVVNTGGNLKAIGFYPALSPEHRQELQRQVDRIFGLFSTFVSDCRAYNGAVVPNTAMQGQVLLGIDALPAGLVDAIGSKEDAYEALLMEIEIEEQPVPEAQPTEEHIEKPAQDAASPASK